MTVEEKKEISESQAVVEEKVAPKPEAEKTPVELLGSAIIDKRREEVEEAAILENATHTPTVEDLLAREEPAKSEESDKASKPEDKKEEVAETEETDPVKRVMSKVQKRIDKVVAQKKSVEEELAETRSKLAEIEAKQNAQVIGNKDDAKSTEPSDMQIAAYLKKVREEGNTEEEVRVLDYIAERRAKVERKSAIDEYESRAKTQREAKAKQDQAVTELLLDFSVKDDKGKFIHDDPMNLANVNGILRKTADGLFNDPELKAQYSDPDRVSAYRRAVNDAFRTIYQLGLNKSDSTVSEAQKPTSKRKLVLVEPTNDGSSEVQEAPPSGPITDQDKVMEEVRNRRKFQVTRTRSVQ